ncbi:YlmC/YmxH family sporulation protein [Halanaerobaculum tunisiense]
MRTSELEAKEIININTGQRLGVVMDVDVNLSGGQIKGLVVPKENKMFSFFGAGEEIYISWSEIHKIGDDVILIQPNEELSAEIPE